MLHHFMFFWEIYLFIPLEVNSNTSSLYWWVLDRVWRKETSLWCRMWEIRGDMGTGVKVDTPWWGGKMVQLGLDLKPFPGTVGECPFRASVMLVLKQAAAPTSDGEKECCQCWSVWASGAEWPTAEGHGEDPSWQWNLREGNTEFGQKWLPQKDGGSSCRIASDGESICTESRDVDGWRVVPDSSREGWVLQQTQWVCLYWG